MASKADDIEKQMKKTPSLERPVSRFTVHGFFSTKGGAKIDASQTGIKAVVLAGFHATHIGCPFVSRS